MKRLTLFISLLVVVGVVVFSFVISQDPRIKIENIPEYYETIYSINHGDKEFKVVTHQTELNKNTMSYISSSTNIDEQIGPLKRILKVVKKREKMIPYSIFWRSTKSYPEFYQRVSAATAKSKLWNIKRGRPYRGHENLTMIKIANEAKTYPELTKLFAEFGHTVRVSGVEKVFIDPKTKLPYNFLLWFRIEPIGEAK